MTFIFGIIKVSPKSLPTSVLYYAVTSSAPLLSVANWYSFTITSSADMCQHLLNCSLLHAFHQSMSKHVYTLGKLLSSCQFIRSKNSFSMVYYTTTGIFTSQKFVPKQTNKKQNNDTLMQVSLWEITWEITTTTMTKSSGI